jgi:hypothetical protein
MINANPLLGFVTEQHAPPRELGDQKERSAKKIKGHTSDDGVLKDGGNEGDHEGNDAMVVSKSYKDSVIGTKMVGEDDEGRTPKEATGEKAEADGGVRLRVVLRNKS